ncbi:MAG: hypothetical protein J6Y03_03235 [Alphaproteobacteria bacterium]|nr:hypothetical protein [Alphaproteobacteria bacterium]
MKKKLFILALLSLIATPVFAECVCGTMGCDPCDNMEDYLEDVGKHMKKQSRKLSKHMRKQKKYNRNMSCMGANPEFWSEEAVILDKNGDVILYYAELVEDDTLSLTAAQKTQAKADAKSLKDAGQKLKDKATSQKEKCMQSVEVTEEVIETMTEQKGKMQKNQPQWVWLDAMEENGNMLIDVGELIETNVNK